MNRVAIFGGLGNQMFQYALAISMDANGIPTKISVNDFLLNRHYQGFELVKAFNVPLPIFDRMKASIMTKVRPLFVDTNPGLVKNTLSRLFLKGNNIFQEKMEYHYDEEVLRQSSSFLIGTWQSPRYFESQQQLIREVFNFNKPHDDINMQMSGEIANSNAVAVHVRRGFYLEPTLTRSRMVIDSSDYYYKAFDVISEQVDNPVFYVFSDDIEWAKRNLRGRKFVFVSHNKGANSYLDMYLMSLCKHFIIANSAFSWWPAWLSANENKIVVLPKPWIRETDCPSIYPNNWLAVSVLNNQMQLVS
ncbi:alpha-1,2-fucosyltransferase [Algoriphagus terrigena]|uniref:alpha-1,2-fucosyltransferase n=1 Tax=Algoriphagus terrigena TaxID=344884 RepID=UPI0003FB78D8|nr:alpha-1,2-fucosyltransferase [Algoriphagus terrigena]